LWGGKDIMKYIKSILSIMLLVLFVMGIILSSIFTVIVLFLPDVPGDQEMLDSIFPEWFDRLSMFIFFGPFIYIPTGILGIIYCHMNRKAKKP
jgi:hypothetical protein